MNKPKHIIQLSIILTLGLFSLGSFRFLENFYGFNHLNFLPFSYSILIWVVLVVVAYLLYGKISINHIDQFIDKLSYMIWERNAYAILLVSLLFALIFFLFRLETHFLGDGYSWLAILGKGESYVHKWTEPLSLYLIRFIQSLFGGYTEQTALYAFEILSIISGVLSVFIIFVISKLISSKPNVRFFTLVTLLFSTHLLMYFGYVEFYSMSWAATLGFVCLSIKYIRGSGNLWVLVLSYLIALSIHLQALYLLPGFVYLVVSSFNSKKVRTFGYISMIIGAVSSLAYLIWLYNTEIRFEILILPPLTGRPPADEYTILSSLHLFDLLNIVLLLFPGIIVLISLSLFSRWKEQFKNRDFIYLLLLSLGSISFLLFYGAAITMAIDWDIMALTLLAPVMLLLYLISKKNNILTGKILASYSFVIFFIAVTFLSVNFDIESSEKRFHSLLTKNHRSSWMILKDYYYDKGEKVKTFQIQAEADKHFPDYLKLKNHYQYFSDKTFETAKDSAVALFNRNRYNADFAQLAGNLYGKLNINDSALLLYKRAAKLKPYNTGILNELGQLMIKMRKTEDAKKVLKRAIDLAPGFTSLYESLSLAYFQQNSLDSAVMIAKDLFAKDVNSPGAHLIMLNVNLQKGDYAKAKLHYEDYLIYGKNRSDYKNIFEYYHYLIEEH